MTRTQSSQAEHDRTIASLAALYARRQDEVWTNPGEQNNKLFSGLHPDVIVHDRRGYYLFEVETEDSVTEEEAVNEWAEFDDAWKIWYLAVPAEKKAEAVHVVLSLGLQHCKVVTYQQREDGIPTFAGIP